MDQTHIVCERRQQFYARLGTVSEQVVGRIPLPGSAQVWPASAIGRLAIIRGDEHVILITDGLSDPWDPELHAGFPIEPLAFELCIVLRPEELEAATDAQLASSWYADLLWSAADWLVVESKQNKLEFVRKLAQFGCLTLGIQARTPEAAQRADTQGNVGLLVGIPMVGDDITRHVYINGAYAGLPASYAELSVGLFPLVVLNADEYERAKRDASDGAVRAATALMNSGTGLFSSSRRESIEV